MQLHFHNTDYAEPPGCFTQFLRHPGLTHRSIEFASFNEHRYAFYFWNKWTQEIVYKNDYINHIPALITLDWHQDLVLPTKEEKRWLRQLDLTDNLYVSAYSWANLGTLNDRHIMAAAYLNLIGDVYVHCRQGRENDRKDEIIKDIDGRPHVIKKFRTFEALEAHLINSDVVSVYFDIDLDFFTTNNPLNRGQQGMYSYLSNKKIREMLRADRLLISWIFQRMWGFTIALEPEHTGGLLKSQKLFALIDQIYFEPSLGTTIPGNYDKSTQWKHLRKKI